MAVVQGLKLIRKSAGRWLAVMEIAEESSATPSRP